MCFCASEASRSRLFNCVSVLLVTIWVLLVSIVAHTAELEPVPTEQALSVFVDSLIK